MMKASAAGMGRGTWGSGVLLVLRPAPHVARARPRLGHADRIRRRKAVLKTLFQRSVEAAAGGRILMLLFDMMLDTLFGRMPLFRGLVGHAHGSCMIYGNTLAGRMFPHEAWGEEP